MRKKYKLSLQAEQDLLDIFLFGLENWGNKQADEYANELSACFELLAKNSNIGLVRNELYEGTQSLICGSHVIFYRKLNSIVEISRILHQKLDIKSKFTEH